MSGFKFPRGKQKLILIKQGCDGQCFSQWKYHFSDVRNVSQPQARNWKG